MNHVPRREGDRKPFEYRTEHDKETNEFMTKSAFQAKNGWVSPFPKGDPNRTEFVSNDQQTENMAFERRRRNYQQK